MQEQARVPAIRFAGFTDAWERRKLGDVFEEYSEKGHPELPALTIIQGGGTIPRDESDRNLQYDKSSLSSYKLVNADDFIVHLRSFEGGLEKATTLGIISPAYHTFHGEETDSRFYYAYFRSHQFINKDLKPHVYGIRDGRSIDIDGMKTIDIPYININEQRAIGDFIRRFDHLITLHQRKYSRLCNVKKSMLEKMFPKDGASMPEIRFAGFTDAWEQRKLTEFVDFFPGLTYTPGDVQENGTLVLRSSNVSNGEIVDADNVYVRPEVVNAENVKVGDIIVVVRNGSRSLIGKHAQIKRFMPNTVIGAFMTGIRSGCPAFTNVLLNTSHFEKEVSMNMGATINQITGYMFSKMEFSVPSLGEQKKIGAFFESLDHLITLHQRELERLQNIKKACLEKMFV